MLFLQEDFRRRFLWFQWRQCKQFNKCVGILEYLVFNNSLVRSLRIKSRNYKILYLWRFILWIFNFFLYFVFSINYFIILPFPIFLRFLFNFGIAFFIYIFLILIFLFRLDYLSLFTLKGGNSFNYREGNNCKEKKIVSIHSILY